MSVTTCSSYTVFCFDDQMHVKCYCLNVFSLPSLLCFCVLGSFIFVCVYFVTLCARVA